jgi:peptide/nickel transport system substrate-binding protein
MGDRKSFARAALLGLGLALVLGCSGPRAPGAEPDASDPPRRGGTAVLGSISDVDAWNEYVSQQSFAVGLLRRIFLRLAQDTGQGVETAQGFEPLLAESWTRSADGRALTFRLRDARWSDGTPVSAEDVRFTWRAQTSPAVPWVGVASKARIRDVVVLDPRTVRFEFDGPYPYQLADAVEGGIVPQHVFGRVPFEGWATHDWSAERIGSGPFILARHVPQQEIELERNPFYFVPDRPLLDRVVVRIAADDTSLVTQLETGEIDWLDGVPAREAQRLGTPGTAVRLVAFDQSRYDFIGWNGARPPFDDPEVRRALTQAIDREALVDEMLFGFGRVSRGPLPSAAWGADRAPAAWAYDPGAARAALVARGFDGATRPLEFELVTNAGNRMREEMTVKIQEQLARIGVRVTVRALEMKTLRQEVARGAYDAYLGGWTFTGKVDLASLFASDRVPPAGLNVVRYRAPEVDREIGRLDRATSGAEMVAPLLEIQRRIHDDAPYTFLYEPRRVAGYGARLRGVVVDVPTDPLARLDRFWVEAS